MSCNAYCRPTALQRMPNQSENNPLLLFLLPIEKKTPPVTEGSLVQCQQHTALLICHQASNMLNAKFIPKL